jgi:hypothetical protein
MILRKKKIRICFASIVLLFINKAVVAQINFKIENISIKKIIEERPRKIINDSTYIEVWEEGFGEGPHITIKCKISNNSNDTLILHPEKSELSIIFKYRKKEYVFTYDSFFSLFSSFFSSFFSEDTVFIPPNANVTFEIEQAYLHGTDFFTRNNIDIVDCTEVVIATLPTLKIRYKDENIDIVTDEILNVTVGDIPYKYEW